MSPRSTPSLEALLASFQSARDAAERAHLAAALLRTRLRDDRILAALVRALEDDPLAGAAWLATYGDARALPDLTRALESEELIAKADCAICAAQHLGAIAETIGRLGGRLTAAQRARLARVEREAARLWRPGPSGPPFGPAATSPAIRAPRPGRNEACPCGSGRKYKRCCAVAIAAAVPLH